jgi:uncharacterized UPF0160 family protein
MKKIVTHNQGFHADDVFAYAILKEYLSRKGETWSLERTRDMEIIKQADVVFDVGEEYDPLRNRFDHHQRGRAGTRANGIYYGAAGLVWKHFGRELCSDNYVWESIDRGLFQELDAIDNGQDFIGKINFDDAYYTSLAIHIAHFEPMKYELKTPEELMEAFEKAADFAHGILMRMIANQEFFQKAFSEASEIYHASEDKQILVFEKNYQRPTWKRLSEFPEPVFAVYYNNKYNDWKIESIPVQVSTFEARKHAPESWRGLRDEDLQKITGVSDAKFCHPSGFLFGAASKTGALELAKKALLM